MVMLWRTKLYRICAQSKRLDVIYIIKICMEESTRQNYDKIEIMKQNATLLTQIFLSFQSRNDGHKSGVFKYEKHRELWR